MQKVEEPKRFNFINPKKLDEKATIRLLDKKHKEKRKEHSADDVVDPYTLPHNAEPISKGDKNSKRGPYRTAKNNFGLGCGDCTSITCKFNQFPKT